MDQQSVTKRLESGRFPWRLITAITAGVAVGVAAVFIGGAVLTPETGRDGTSVVHLAGSESKPTTPQMDHKLLLTTHVAKTTTPPPPPEPVYVAPPSGGGGGNSGALVPFYPSSDPNNASGGDYADPGSFCSSGSASGFPPVCD